MSEDKKSLLEAIRLGREIKEAVPAGSDYPKAKAAVQFYKGVMKDLQRREEEARKRMEALSEEPRDYELREDAVVIPYPEDMSELLATVDALRRHLEAAWSLVSAQKGQETVKELMQWEENHSNKVGIEEIRRKLLDDSILTAAALQDREG